MILLGCDRGIKAQRLANLFTQSDVGIHNALVVINMRGGIGQWQAAGVEGGLIAIVIGELRLAAIVQFPPFWQCVGLVGSEEPLAHFLAAIYGEVAVDIV